MRRLFISADMEGCSAVSAPQGLLPDRWAWEWNAARRWMTEEVVAVADVALSTHYDEILVSDSHGNAHNIDPDALPDNVRLIRSWPRPLLHMQGIDDGAVDACVFIGYHSASRQPDSILAHTYSGAAFRAIRLNGEICSEGYLNAALAGEYGKPVIFVSGDEQTTHDVRRYAPEATVFVSKQSLGWRCQMSLPPRQVRGMLRQEFANALGRPLPKAFLIQGPFNLELEMTTQVAAEMLSYLPGVERSNAMSVTVTFDRLERVMRFVSFAMLYSPTGVPAL